MRLRSNGHPWGGLMTGFLGLALLWGCQGQATTVPSNDAPHEPETAAPSGIVTLRFELPEQDQPIEIEKTVAPGTTLESLMRDLQEPSMQLSGSGVTAYVQSIAGVEPTAERGWTFTIDGEFASEGIGSIELSPPQTIVWRFTTLSEAMQP